VTYSVRYTDDAIKSLSIFRKSNPLAYKKVMKLIDELHEHPGTGTGHPEVLGQSNANITTYSRRITKKDRLVYDIDDTKVVVLVLSVEGHYGDK
jgi:toxin YoeB